MSANVSTVRRAAVVTSVLLYLASFFLPAILFRSVTQHGGKYVPSGGMQVYFGSNMALASVFGPLCFNFAGLANPFWLIGSYLFLMNKLRPARICLAIAALLALQTFQLLIQPLPYDEGEVVQGILVHPLIGWYAWLTALLLPLLCSFLPGITGRRKPRASGTLPT